VWNIWFSHLSPTSAVDFIKTKTSIGLIVSALKCIKTVVSCGLSPQLFAAHNTSKYWRTLYRHVTGRNVRFSDFSPSSVIDVLETKKVIGQIFSGLKVIRAVLSSGLFTTIVCCSQHVEILTNSVFARRRAKCLIFRFFAKFNNRRRQNEKRYCLHFLALKGITIVFLSRLFTTNVCCLQLVEI